MKKLFKCIVISLVLIFININNGYTDKMRIAVLNLRANGVSQRSAVAATNLIISQLINSNKFIVVERNQVDEILKEQGFQQTGCTDQECAVQIGKLLSANKILVGELTEYENSILITVRVVDVEKGIAEYASYGKALNEVDLDESIDKVVTKLIERMEVEKEKIFEKDSSSLDSLKKFNSFLNILFDVNITSAPAGIFFSYNNFVPTSSPFKDYYDNLSGGALGYSKDYNTYISYQIGSSFVIGSSKNEIKAKTFINSYSIGLRCGVPIYSRLYPYIGSSIIASWCKEYYDKVSANFFGYGIDGHIGLGFMLFRNMLLYSQYNYIYQKVNDDENTNIGGNLVSIGIMYNI